MELIAVILVLGFVTIMWRQSTIKICIAQLEQRIAQIGSAAPGLDTALLAAGIDTHVIGRLDAMFIEQKELATKMYEFMLAQGQLFQHTLETIERVAQERRGG